MNKQQFFGILGCGFNREVSLGMSYTYRCDYCKRRFGRNEQNMHACMGKHIQERACKVEVKAQHEDLRNKRRKKW